MGSLSLWRRSWRQRRAWRRLWWASDHSVSKIIIFKSAAGSISFRSTVSQSCSIHACVGGPRPRAGRASALRWRCRRLAAACPVRLVGDIRHATAVVHKVFGQENKPGAPVTSSQGARDTNVRPPNRAWEGRARLAKLAAAVAAEPEPEPEPAAAPGPAVLLAQAGGRRYVASDIRRYMPMGGARRLTRPRPYLDRDS